MFYHSEWKKIKGKRKIKHRSEGIQGFASGGDDKKDFLNHRNIKTIFLAF